MKFRLTRENDNKILEGEKIAFIEWNENGGFHKKHEEPAEGRSLILDPHRFSYTWLTTKIISFISLDNIIKFSTKNSNYILEKFN